MGAAAAGGLVTVGELTTGCADATGCADGLTAGGVLTEGVAAADAGVAAADANAVGVVAPEASGLKTPSAKVSTRLTVKTLMRKRPLASAQRALEILRSNMLTLSAARAAATAVAIVCDLGGPNGLTRPAG
jgi:hypothetical protein